MWRGIAKGEHATRVYPQIRHMTNILINVPCTAVVDSLTKTGPLFEAH